MAKEQPLEHDEDYRSVEEQLEDIALEMKRDEQSEEDNENDPNWKRAVNARKLTKEVRISLIQRLQIRGIRSAVEQQQALRKMDPPHDLTLRTIYRYRGIIKKRSLAQLGKDGPLTESLEKLVLKLKATYEEVERELWRVYHDKNTPAKNKVAALNAIKATADSWVEKLQDLGLAHREPDKHQLVGADGKPSDSQVVLINQQFTAFIKARYQDPIPHDQPSKIN